MNTFDSIERKVSLEYCVGLQYTVKVLAGQVKIMATGYK